jgi:hypothetical protein
MTEPVEHPELIVLEALLETCRQTVRLNRSLPIRRAAIEMETKLESQKARLLAKICEEPQPEVAA